MWLHNRNESLVLNHVLDHGPDRGPALGQGHGEDDGLVLDRVHTVGEVSGNCEFTLFTDHHRVANHQFGKMIDNTFLLTSARNSRTLRYKTSARNSRALRCKTSALFL